MSNRITEKQVAFYKLYQEFKEDPTKYVSAWEFGGDIFLKEIGKWELMTYKTPARLSDLFKENPKLLDRHWTTGKSGKGYYVYRINQTEDGLIGQNIDDLKLREFYLRIKK